MTQSNLEKTLRTHQAGQLARNLFNDDDLALAGGALEAYAHDNGILNRADGFIQGALATKEGTDKATQVYSQKYQDAMKGATIADLQTHYDKYLLDYLTPEQAESIKAEFDKFPDQTYGDIIKQVAKAQYILEGKEKKVYEKDSQEVYDASVIMERYGSLIKSIGMLESIKMEKIRPRAAKRAHKTGLEGLSDSLKDTARYRQIVADAMGSE